MSSTRVRLGLFCSLLVCVASGAGCGSSATPNDAAWSTTPVTGGSSAGGGVVGGGGAGGAGGLANADAAAAGGVGGGTSAPSCGQPGTPCCDGNGCNGGGCCVSGICMAVGGSCVGLGGGTCNAGACGSCGSAGLPCCGSNSATGVCTAAATVCSAGTCTKCGELGSPCCPATSGSQGICNAQNAICGTSNVCMTCGAPGAPCCPGNACASPGCCYNNVCTAEGTTCGSTGGACQAGRCSACGGTSQPCCSNLCYDSLLCKSGICTQCGSLGQTCCLGSLAPCQARMICSGSGSDSLCARCGGLGDVCCAGSACAEGCCSGGRCMAPGTPACPTAGPDGGTQPDAPIGNGGAGGGGGTGAGGVGGAGGTKTGGAGGTSSKPWMPPVGCGDGVVVAPERCDDGNTMPFDGCSSDCQIEPTCAGVGPCTSKCGDGILLGEECDDGNTRDGDGCSSACKTEAGFTCARPALGDSILVPAVYRDFRYKNPTDFEPGVTGSEKASPGMVEATLDADGKPVFTGVTGGAIKVSSKETFASWYRNTANLNHATASKLAMWSNGSGAYVNRWGAGGERWQATTTYPFCGTVGSELLDANGVAIPCTYKYGKTDCDGPADAGRSMLRCELSSSTYRGIFAIDVLDGTPVFFPVDGDTFTPATERSYAQIPPVYGSKSWDYEVDASGNKVQHNFSFTSEIRYWFEYDANKTFRLDILGDDDVWVFINKQLAVDLGGIHTPVEGSLTIDVAAATKLGLTVGNVYEIAVFQAERQSYSSTLKITLGAFNTSPSECRHP